MKYIHTDLSDEALTKVNLDNIVYYSPIPYNLPGSESHMGNDICWAISDIPFQPCNVVIKARLEDDTTDATIRFLLGKARERGVSLRWYVDDDSKPSDLGDRLIANGFTTWEKPSTFMAVDLHAMKVDVQPPAGMEIREVITANEMEIWSEVATRGFGGVDEHVIRNLKWFSRIQEHRLPMYFYLAYLDGQPAAVSNLVPAEGVGGLYYVATLPEFRNKGLGFAVTMKACQAAREMGYRVATLQASAMGEPVYKRMGFRISGGVRVYTWANS